MEAQEIRQTMQVVKEYLEKLQFTMTDAQNYGYVFKLLSPVYEREILLIAITHVNQPNELCISYHLSSTDSAVAHVKNAEDAIAKINGILMAIAGQNFIAYKRVLENMSGKIDIGDDTKIVSVNPDFTTKIEKWAPKAISLIQKAYKEIAETKSASDEDD